MSLIMDMGVDILNVLHFCARIDNQILINRNYDFLKNLQVVLVSKRIQCDSDRSFNGVFDRNYSKRSFIICNTVQNCGNCAVWNQLIANQPCSLMCECSFRT